VSHGVRWGSAKCKMVLWTKYTDIDLVVEISVVNQDYLLCIQSCMAVVILYMTLPSIDCLFHNKNLREGKCFSMRVSKYNASARVFFESVRLLGIGRLNGN
jgi:hypothetical protein